jgi:hypothetical protein
LERQNLVDVRGIIYRHLKVTKSAGQPKISNGTGSIAWDVLDSVLGRRKTKDVDLANLAERYNTDLALLHSGIIVLAQSRAIEIEPLDDDRGESWILAVLSTKETWSEAHMKYLEQMREEDLAESNKGLAALMRCSLSEASKSEMNPVGFTTEGCLGTARQFLSTRNRTDGKEWNGQPHTMKTQIQSPMVNFWGTSDLGQSIGAPSIRPVKRVGIDVSLILLRAAWGSLPWAARVVGLGVAYCDAIDQGSKFPLR